MLVAHAARGHERGRVRGMWPIPLVDTSGGGCEDPLSRVPMGHGCLVGKCYEDISHWVCLHLREGGVYLQPQMDCIDALVV